MKEKLGKGEQSISSLLSIMTSRNYIAVVFFALAAVVAGMNIRFLTSFDMRLFGVYLCC